MTYTVRQVPARMSSELPSEMSLYLKFNGPAVEGGRLEVTDLAPALVGLHGLTEVACQAVHGDATKIRLDIKAGLRQGSFTADFVLAAADGQLLEGLSLEDLYHLKELIIGTGGVGLLALCKWLRGRKIARIERTDTHAAEGRALVHAEDGSSIQISLHLGDIIADAGTSAKLKDLVTPLDNPGIVSMDLGTEEEGAHTIERKDRRYYKRLVSPDNVIRRTVSETVLEIVSPVFREGQKWRFGQGDSVVIFAEILDKEFNERVSSGLERFASGDFLEVEMETEITKSGKKTVATHRILRVIDHIPTDQTQPELAL